jgi:hypothetical protein
LDCGLAAIRPDAGEASKGQAGMFLSVNPKSKIQNPKLKRGEGCKL